tara:strand:- start:15291 stop:16466 length:1176 start_codon:yes stop_codon:yes gene_type:complete
MYSIIGSGIGGLALSSFLSKKNIRCEVYEKNNEFYAENYGIQISPNASHILEKLGVIKNSQKEFTHIHNIEIHSIENLKKLTSLPVQEFVLKNNLSQYYTTSRNTLYKLLLEYSKKNGVKVNFKSEISRVSVNQNGPIIIKKDQKELQKRNVIIANGNINQTLNKNIHIIKKNTNFYTLRSVVEISEIPFNISGNSIIIFMGNNMHIVIYPFYKTKVNLVMILNKKYIDHSSYLESNERNFDRVRIVNFNKEDNSLVKFVKNANWEIWNLNDHKKKLKLNREHPIYAIGDAAHTIQPHLAQGAAMAIEDAYTLSQIISLKPKSTQLIHDQFYSNRSGRIKKVISRSLNNRKIFHLNKPLSNFRDLYLSNSSGYYQLQKLDWLYSHKSKIDS